jgi:hypothetical protein
VAALLFKKIDSVHPPSPHPQAQFQDSYLRRTRRASMSFFEVQCASDSSSSASDPSSRPGSPDTTNGENALPVSIANNLSASNAVQDLEIYQRTTCLRDWQMYNRLSENGNCTLTPTPKDEMLLEAVYKHIIQAEAEEVASPCLTQADELIFDFDF